MWRTAKRVSLVFVAFVGEMTESHFNDSASGMADLGENGVADT